MYSKIFKTTLAKNRKADFRCPTSLLDPTLPIKLWQKCGKVNLVEIAYANLNNRRIVHELMCLN